MLNDTPTHGRYSGIIIMDALAYSYPTGWNSAVTTDQWNAIFNYQVAFNVRMVRINEYPGANFGVSLAGGGCCNAGVEQPVSLVDTSDYPSANIKA